MQHGLQAYLGSPATVLGVLAGQLVVAVLIALAVMVLVRKLDEILAVTMRNMANELETTKQALAEALVAARTEVLADSKKIADEMVEAVRAVRTQTVADAKFLAAKLQETVQAAKEETIAAAAEVATAADADRKHRDDKLDLILEAQAAAPAAPPPLSVELTPKAVQNVATESAAKVAVVIKEERKKQGGA